MDIRLYNEEIQRLIKNIQASRGIDPKRTIQGCNELEGYGLEHNELGLIGYARFTRGETHYLMNDMKAFYEDMLSCLSPLEEIGEWGYLAMANNLMGIMSVNRGNPPFALDYYIKAISYCREYKLPELECNVLMNIGSLYFNIEDYEDALSIYLDVYNYLSDNCNGEDYAAKFTATCLGLGKCHLALHNLDAANYYNEQIIRRSFDELVESDRLAVYCFQARLFQESKQIKNMHETIATIEEQFNDHVPIMDIFDDFYDYMKMLIDTDKYDDFSSTFNKVLASSRRTNIKNLEIKLIDLQIQMYRKRQMLQDYRTAATIYYELVQEMEKESFAMLSNMMSMRHELYELDQINKKERQKNINLQKKSETDPLTGMYNRMKLNEYAPVAFEKARTNKVGFGIEILDVDYFKEFNDNYGHQRGDECLIFVANAIESLKKHGGVFCTRYGGDEFVIIYEGYTDEEIYNLAKELREVIVNTAFEHEFTKLSTKIVTISQGLFWGVPQEDESVWEFLHKADEELYRGKQESRNTIVIGKK